MASVIKDQATFSVEYPPSGRKKDRIIQSATLSSLSHQLKKQQHNLVMTNISGPK